MKKVSRVLLVAFVSLVIAAAINGCQKAGEGMLEEENVQQGDVQAGKGLILKREFQKAPLELTASATLPPILSEKCAVSPMPDFLFYANAEKFRKFPNVYDAFWNATDIKNAWATVNEVFENNGIKVESIDNIRFFGFWNPTFKDPTTLFNNWFLLVNKAAANSALPHFTKSTATFALKELAFNTGFKGDFFFAGDPRYFNSANDWDDACFANTAFPFADYDFVWYGHVPLSFNSYFKGDNKWFLLLAKINGTKLDLTSRVYVDDKLVTDFSGLIETNALNPDAVAASIESPWAEGANTTWWTHYKAKFDDWFNAADKYLFEWRKNTATR